MLFCGINVSSCDFKPTLNVKKIWSDMSAADFIPKNTFSIFALFSSCFGFMLQFTLLFILFHLWIFGAQGGYSRPYTQLISWFFVWYSDYVDYRLFCLRTWLIIFIIYFLSLSLSLVPTSQLLG